MIERKQLHRHNPPASVGDCHRTAIACLLDLEPYQVPHFGKTYYDDPEKFHAAFDAWLRRERGLAVVSVPYQCGLEHLLAAQAVTNPKAYYLLGGESRTGVDHTVVALGGGIAWDPSMDDAGIVAPCSDGFYWVSYLVPASMTSEPPSEEKLRWDWAERQERAFDQHDGLTT